MDGAQTLCPPHLRTHPHPPTQQSYPAVNSYATAISSYATAMSSRFTAVSSRATAVSSRQQRRVLECPTSTADPGATFIHHGDSFPGSLAASLGPWRRGGGALSSRCRWISGARSVFSKVGSVRGQGRCLFVCLFICSCLPEVHVQRVMCCWRQI